MVIELPKVQLTDEMSATIDKHLDEVRLVFIENGDDVERREIHFVPMARIRELCAKVS